MIGYCIKRKQIVLSEAECYFCNADERGITDCIAWREKIPEEAWQSQEKS